MCQYQLFWKSSAGFHNIGKHSVYANSELYTIGSWFSYCSGFGSFLHPVQGDKECILLIKLCAICRHNWSQQSTNPEHHQPGHHDSHLTAGGEPAEGEGGQDDRG